MPFNQIGFGPKTQAFNSIPISLQSGQTYVLPSGQYQVLPGTYTFMQWFDPTIQNWRPMQTVAQSDTQLISSDGYNYRLANFTGGVVGASVTTTGSGATNGIYTPAGITIPGALPQVSGSTAFMSFSGGAGTVTPSGTVIVGGAVNTTLSLSTVAGTSGTFLAGSAYTRAPILLTSAPPPGGIPCTMTCTISGGAINAVTVTNQGAGYLTAPTVTVVNHPLDTTGNGGSITPNTTLAGSGGVTGIVMQNTGAGYTTASLPSITITGAGSAAASPVFCWTATSVTFTGPTNQGNGNMSLIMSALATAPTLTNPAQTTGLFTPRTGYTSYTTTAGPTTTTIIDGGLHQTTPGAILVANYNGTASAAITVAVVGGGVTDISYILQV